MGRFDYAKTFPESKQRFKFATEKPQSEVVTVDRYFEEWLEAEVARKDRKHSTAEGYRNMTAFFLSSKEPCFTGMPLVELTRPVLKSWLEPMTCGNKRLCNLQSMIRVALNKAVGKNLIDSNPLYGWKFVKEETRNEISADDEGEDEADPFSAEEQQLILAQLDGQRRNIIQFLFWTGLRPSECVALEWRDIDWNKGIVRVRRARTQGAPKPHPPKSKAGRRDVKLLPQALEALNAQKPFTYLANGVIFHDPLYDEAWAGDRQIRRFWARALVKAGIAYRNPYQMRHSYASMMFTAGEDLGWVAKQMGHADLGMVQRVYAHWIDEARPDAGAKAAAMFAAPTIEVKHG